MTFAGDSEPTTSPVTTTEPSTTENVKETTEPPKLDASTTSTIARTTSLVTETTGNAIQRGKFQLSLKVYLVSYYTVHKL